MSLRSILVCETVLARGICNFTSTCDVIIVPLHFGEYVCVVCVVLAPWCVCLCLVSVGGAVAGEAGAAAGAAEWVKW